MEEVRRQRCTNVSTVSAVLVLGDTLMMRVAAFLLIVGALCAQPRPAARFDVASIRPSNNELKASSGIQTGHGKLNARNVTLKRCIMGAFGVGPSQIYGGPAWLDSDRFEIAAETDQPADGDAVLMRMLQNLLAERFQLSVHREIRPMPALALEIAKNGPKLEKSQGGEAITNSSNSNAGSAIDARNTSMDLFATVLARQTERPAGESHRIGRRPSTSNCSGLVRAPLPNRRTPHSLNSLPSSRQFKNSSDCACTQSACPSKSS